MQNITFVFWFRFSFCFVFFFKYFSTYNLEIQQTNQFRKRERGDILLSGLGGLSSTEMGWFGSWLCLQIISFRENRDAITMQLQLPSGLHPPGFWWHKLLGIQKHGNFFRKRCCNVRSTNANSTKGVNRGPTPQRVEWTVTGPSLAGRLHGLGLREWVSSR